MILSYFLKLPAEVSSSILTDWLLGYSVCRLDAACCAYRMREDLLELLSSHSLVLSFIRVNSSLTGKGLLAWALRRNIKLTALSIGPEAGVALHENYTDKLGASVQCICIDSIKSEFEEYVSPTAACKNLKTLFLAECKVGAPLSWILHQYSKLNTLALKNCTGATCDSLMGVIHCELKTLMIENCTTDQICDVVLQKMPTTLQNLSLCNTRDAFSAESLKEELVRLPNLLRLGLSDLDITDAVLVELCIHCKQLIEVDVGGCTLLTDVSVLTLATCCPRLRLLAVCANSNYTDEALSSIAQHLPLLEEVDISDCLGFTTEGVQTVLAVSKHIWRLLLDDLTVPEAQCLPQTLADLLISHTIVTDELLHAIGQRCPCLEELYFDGQCACVFGDEGLPALALGCPELRQLVLPVAVDTAVQKMWQKWRPNMQFNIFKARWILQAEMPGADECGTRDF